MSAIQASDCVEGQIQITQAELLPMGLMGIVILLQASFHQQSEGSSLVTVMQVLTLCCESKLGGTLNEAEQEWHRSQKRKPTQQDRIVGKKVKNSAS